MWGFYGKPGNYFLYLFSASCIFLFSAFSSRRMRNALTAAHRVKDTIKPIQAATLSRGNQPNTTAKAVIAISIVAKNRIFLTISARFLIRISVRKIFCAAVTIRTSRNSSSKVAVDRPAEPKENNVE